MKRFGIGLAVLALCAAPVLADDISQIQANPIHMDYTTADQQLVFQNDETGNLFFSITTEGGSLYQNVPGVDDVNFFLNGYLYDNRSSGGNIWGRFNNGMFDFYWDDNGEIWSIEGDLIALEVRETSDCVFDGSGTFEITEIILPTGIEFPGIQGSIATFTFIPSVCDGYDDWDVDMTGVGFATIVPDGSGFPEPATCLIFAALALGAVRRRK
jgi:hypothetical protein